MKLSCKPALFALSFYVVLSLWRHYQIATENVKYKFAAVDQTAEVLRRYERSAPKRNVIVYLARDGREESLARSIVLLFQNFNRQFRYSIIVFYEAPMNVSQVVHSISYAGYLYQDEYKLIEFTRIRFQLPNGFFPSHGQNVQNLSFIPVARELFPGYHHVLNFWFADVFNHPVMRNVKYFWRLDSDSFIRSPIEYDLFKFMEQNGYLYGYRTVMTDSLYVTVGLFDFVVHFLDRYKILPVPQQLPPIPPSAGFERRNTLVPLYYNNFELVHVPTFREHSGIRLFAKEVVESMKIYEQRWGDAPLRYLSVSMFLDRAKYVHHFCDVNYSHQGNFTPTCQPPASSQLPINDDTNAWPIDFFANEKMAD